MAHPPSFRAREHQIASEECSEKRGTSEPDAGLETGKTLRENGPVKYTCLRGRCQSQPTNCQSIQHTVHGGIDTTFAALDREEMVLTAGNGDGPSAKGASERNGTRMPWREAALNRKL
ncbi:hypothetical protein B0T26DRAFT_757781 [Lasiosphaeria miniovina]|uniref:Uncharacterized protein n=1 Tax=Lasiosphaeria miniovina TaxID=1954250 RepID=A0AA39ZQL4_9PEZI|nr:uncharacterized protein B0T26DRAFT_757781 [Lasiosphaeria miniovina]KAK0701798.1 hypothetical protein B0T26DRAFT_757781 [Lasiosphaeria miniovina]